MFPVIVNELQKLIDPLEPTSVGVDEPPMTNEHALMPKFEKSPLIGNRLCGT